MPQRRSLSDRVTDSFKVITELDLSHAYERQAGALALGFFGVLLVAGVTIGLLNRKNDRMRLGIELPGSGGLARGDPVLVLGVPVGHVDGLRLLGPGRVLATVTIERQYAPRRDADAEVLSLNLSGSQALRYDPGVDTVPLPPGTPVTGRAAPTAMDQLAGLREQAAVLAVRFRKFDPAELRADVDAVRAALARARSVAEAFPGDSVAVDLSRITRQGDSLLAYLAALRDSLHREALAANRERLAASSADLLTQVDSVRGSLGRIRARIREGEGNIGRAQRDSTLRQEIDATRASLQRLLEKFAGRRPPPAATIP